MPLRQRFFNKEKKQNPLNNKSGLKIILIGDTVQKNLTVYEHGDSIIAVDYGIGFPGSDDLGVDVVIPDMSYLLDNKEKVKGIFISHAHADHFAALPYLLQQANFPIYCNKLVQGLLNESFEEKQFKGLKGNVKFHLFNASTPEVDLGYFKISAFGVNHSVPGSLGITINTPEGLILHMADFKTDNTPVLDKPIELDKIKNYGDRGVLCLLSDCLGAGSKGKVASESTLNNTFPDIFAKYKNKQVFITTISSNVSRMYQIIDAAQKVGRKVIPVGRSIEQMIKVSRNIGYLLRNDDLFLDRKNSSEYDQTSVVYLIAGCFGQRGSSLDRVSRDEYDGIHLDDGAVVVISSEPNPPGVGLDYECMVSNIVLAGGEVIDYKVRDDLHVSGHGHIEDLKLVINASRPKYFIPNGGTPRQLRDYTHMVEGMGYNKSAVFELREGESVVFSGGEAKRGETIKVVDLYIDGTPVDPIVIRDRYQLSNEGVFVVIIPVSKKNNKVIGPVDVVTRGFVYVKESKALMGKSRSIVNKILAKDNGQIKDWKFLKGSIEKRLFRYLLKVTGRRPIIIVHSLFI